ncbi:MAG: hypothetical protein K2X82_30130 [Gemmataceae bacterium]|nr:hypothetical protein [Gemmataceae bacterium]
MSPSPAPAVVPVIRLMPAGSDAWTIDCEIAVPAGGEALVTADQLKLVPREGLAVKTANLKVVRHLAPIGVTAVLHLNGQPLPADEGEAGKALYTALLAGGHAVLTNPGPTRAAVVVRGRVAWADADQ